MDTCTWDKPSHDRNGWPVVGLLLDALTRRDFAAFGACLADDVRFRALVPPGPFELGTAAETEARFRRWFDGEDAFEVVDASVGQLGGRLYARWRIRMQPPGRPEAARIVEQHIFTTGNERVETLDLLCSGFQLETGVTS